MSGSRAFLLSCVFLLACGTLNVIAWMVWAGYSPASDAAVLYLIVLSPWIAMSGLCWWVKDVPSALTILMVSALAYMVVSNYAIYDSMIVHPDAQAALVFVVIPIDSFFVLPFVALLLWGTKVRHRKLMSENSRLAQRDVPSA